MRRFFFLILTAAVFFGNSTLRAEGTLADKTLVVFNQNDPESEQLARYYAARRDVPDRQVIGLRCATTEEISRDEYDTTIAEPLRHAFDSANWWETTNDRNRGTVVIKNKIRFIALIRGMPLKIREKGTYEGDKSDPSTPYGAVNAASVDSDLAVLGRFTRQISGPINNPYYQNFDRIDAVELPQLMLISRLDGPTYDDVKRMIDDSLRTELSGLIGWTVLDERGTELSGYKLGDDWIKKAGTYLGKAGFPVFTDATEPILPSGLPLPKTAVYLGWYSGDMAGALAGTGVRFAPGAIACHIHSFSASTVRSPTSGWCGPLIHAGADAVLGNVYEPFLALTANLDIFTERLLRGYTFAESAWASQQAVSWMNIAIGDPLYRPYANLPKATWPAEYKTFQLSAKQDLVNFDSGLSAEAWAQRLQVEGDEAQAIFLFQKALKKYTDPDNLARVAWSYSQLLLKQNKKDAALAVLKDIEGKIHGTTGANFLLARIGELQPPPAVAAPSPVVARGQFVPEPPKARRP